MRLHEIDDQDKTWAKSAGINLDIDSIYTSAINILNMLSKLSSQRLRDNWLPTVEMCRDDLIKIINANLSDDESTTELKSKATKMLNNIDNLISKL